MSRQRALHEQLRKQVRTTLKESRWISPTSRSDGGRYERVVTDGRRAFGRGSNLAAGVIDV